MYHKHQNKTRHNVNIACNLCIVQKIWMPNTSLYDIKIWSVQLCYAIKEKSTFSHAHARSQNCYLSELIWKVFYFNICVYQYCLSEVSITLKHLYMREIQGVQATMHQMCQTNKLPLTKSPSILQHSNWMKMSSVFRPGLLYCFCFSLGEWIVSFPFLYITLNIEIIGVCVCEWEKKRMRKKCRIFGTNDI